MSFLNGKLNTTEDGLNLLHGDSNTTEADLNALTDEANKLDRNVQDLRQQVRNAKNANIYGEKSNHHTSKPVKPLKMKELSVL